MAFKNIKCPWCGKEARITYEENRVYQMKCYSCRNTMLHVDHSFDSAVDFFEHHANLLQAEQDGRLVILPCKVGDSVYIPDLEKKIPVKVRVQGISISVSGRTILHFGGYPVECAWGDGCGKDLFLTREEAETALAGKGGDV